MRAYAYRFLSKYVFAPHHQTRSSWDNIYNALAHRFSLYMLDIHLPRGEGADLRT